MEFNVPDAEGVIYVDALFQSEIKAADQLLNEAWKSSDGYADAVFELADSALNRAFSVALSDWADPNQRCAAVTLALALIACPEQVWLIKPRDHQAPQAEYIEAYYKTVQIALPQPDFKSAQCFLVETSIPSAVRRAAPNHTVLENLAVTYQDAERNQRSLLHLKKYLPMAEGKVEKAAVLGLAWLMLQRRERELSRVLDISADSAGYFLTCAEPNLGIREFGGRILEAWYPGLRLRSEET